MKIHGSTDIATQVNRSSLAETKQPDGKTSGTKLGGDETGEGAIVDFSQRSKDIQKAQQVLQLQSDVRADKVKAIKEKIEKGTYEIDFDGTADKMVKVFFDEMT
jgi:flagellar biosynthesis anti-sigma factor FlgM